MDQTSTTAPATPPRRRRRIPFIQQMAANECGAACLAMSLGYFGKDVVVEDVTSIVAAGRDGANLMHLMHGARWFGLRARGVQLDVAELAVVGAGAILHWEFKHFVVFERLRKDGVVVVDPALGRRTVPLEQFRRSFTGVALLLEPSDTFRPGKRPSRPIWSYLRQTLARSGSWSRILVTSLLLQLFALALPMLTGMVVDRIVPRGDGRLLVVTAVGLGGLVGFYFLASMVRSHLLLHLRTFLDSRMTLGFIEHLLELRYGFFQQRPTGDLMNRVNSNAIIREMLTSGTLSALIDGTFVLGYLVLLVIASPGIALLALTLAAMQVLVFVLSWPRQRALMVDGIRTQSASESYLVELLSGIETLKASGTELRAGERWSSLFVDQLNVSFARGKMTALVDALTNTLRMGAPLVLLCFGASRVLDGSLTLGAMLSVLALAQGLLTPVSSLVGSASQLMMLGGYLDRIEDVLLAAPEQERDKVRPAPQLHGRIALEDVSFRYTPTAPEVVRGASVEIEAGQFVAIVGRSGSGKSTLASLLLGLYPPTSGRIRYDGVDLAEMDLRSVRRQLGIVTQRSYLFGTTIRGNIAHGDPSLSLEEVMEAARRAGIHDEIAAMPMNYSTPLLDGGTSISGGQRQRIALARALATRPAILLLDEATSALDVVSERLVQRHVAELGCTRLVIAHRLSTVRDADLILVMDRGQIVERGTHAELMARGGHYRDLIAAQQGGVTERAAVA